MQPEWRAYHSWRRLAASRTVFASWCGQARHSNIRRIFLSTFSWGKKKIATTAIPVRHNSTILTISACPFYIQAAHREQHMMTSSSSSTSHSHPRDETPEKVNEWISRFKILWVKSETCLGVLPNCQTPRPWKTSVLFWSTMALRIRASHFALNCLASRYC